MPPRLSRLRIFKRLRELDAARPQVWQATPADLIVDPVQRPIPFADLWHARHQRWSGPDHPPKPRHKQEFIHTIWHDGHTSGPVQRSVPLEAKKA